MPRLLSQINGSGQVGIASDGISLGNMKELNFDSNRVKLTSTDQAGTFRIRDDLKINQETGTISGRAFSKSLFSEMTPFILALS